MKRFLPLLPLVAALLAPLAAQALDPAAGSEILKLLNSRAAGNTRDYEEAAAVVARDAASGKPLQQFILAVISRDAHAPKAARISAALREEYLNRSRARIQALAEKKGNALAWYLLSLETNDMKKLKRAVDGENIQALNAWGTITLTDIITDPNINTNDLERLLVSSYRCFSKAAAHRDANGLYNVGMCLMQGYGCKPDAERALECFRAAAEMRHPEAINNIGGFYRDGIVVERDPVLAAKWFARSADLGNAYGELNYALALLRGEGVEQDVERAARMLKASAEQGNEEAMNAYGMCLYNGEGVAQDRLDAGRWYRASAQRGFAPAMENLATCYEKGTAGFRKDAAEALRWRMRARAVRGDRNAAAWLQGQDAGNARRRTR